MYTDWLAFQSECKKSRAEAERQVAIKKRKQIEMLVQLLTIVGICAVVIPIFILAAIFFFNR